MLLVALRLQRLPLVNQSVDHLLLLLEAHRLIDRHFLLHLKQLTLVLRHHLVLLVNGLIRPHRRGRLNFDRLVVFGAVEARRVLGFLGRRALILDEGLGGVECGVREGMVYRVRLSGSLLLSIGFVKRV